MINVLNYTKTALVTNKDYLTYPMFTVLVINGRRGFCGKVRIALLKNTIMDSKKIYVRMEMIKVTPNVLPKSVVHCN